MGLRIDVNAKSESEIDMAKKGSNKQLTRATHKGRSTKTGKQGKMDGGVGLRGTGLNIKGTARLTSSLLTGGLSPTPKGPEPGHGGRMY